MTRIVWSRNSRDDLARIRAFIARDAPRTAEAYVKRLVAQTRRLRRFPYSGAVIPDFQREDIREILFGNYRIIYRTVPDRVIILAVYHTARLLDEGILGDSPAE